jgi:cytochrome c biogenesis protein CcmG, thiol:disulfide interchange protein DsbE
VVVVAVNTAENDNPLANARAFKEKHHLTYPILMDTDGKVRELFGVPGYPTNILIDREGKVRAVVLGFDRGEIDKTLQEMMSESPR